MRLWKHNKFPILYAFLLQGYCKSACLSSFGYELFSCRHRLFVANNKTGGIRGA